MILVTYCNCTSTPLLSIMFRTLSALRFYMGPLWGLGVLLGVLLDAFGSLLGSLWGALGAPGRSLGDPWGHIGLSLLVLRCPWPLLGCTLALLVPLDSNLGAQGHSCMLLGDVRCFSYVFCCWNSAWSSLSFSVFLSLLSSFSYPLTVACLSCLCQLA